MYYRTSISDLYNRSHYNTTEIKDVAKIFVACGLQENFLTDMGFFDSYYTEFNSTQDIHDCMNERKEALTNEGVNINELIASIEDLLNCQNSTELNTKYAKSILYAPGIRVEESESPFSDYDSLGEYERDDFWECFEI